MKNFNTTARYALSAFALAAAAAGCQSSNKSAGIPNNPAVTDIAPVPPSYQQPQPAAAPIAPVYTQQPVTSMVMASNTVSTNAPSAGGNTYTVQKGDTLFKIAREHYGDASAWHKIAAANPGAGNIIKPGQKLVLP